MSNKEPKITNSNVVIHHIKFCLRYMDDALACLTVTSRQLHNFLNFINRSLTKIHFTLEAECDGMKTNREKKTLVVYFN